MRLRLERVRCMPDQLMAGVLYLSEEFGTAAHLCPCGCGEKIRTPLGSTEWSFEETALGPSLYPSVGNWQLPCRSHYWIRDGQVIWAGDWTEAQITAGRMREAVRRARYYESAIGTRPRVLQRVVDWVKNALGWS